MRIQRSALFIARHITKVLLQKTTIVAFSVALLAVGVIVGQNVLTTPDTSYAATPVDSCFFFDGASGTINEYYENEGGNPANPACPRAVDIPATIGGAAVTTIGTHAFISGSSTPNDQITSVTIPNSVTTIGDNAFMGNLLNTITIPGSVTSMGSAAFAYNQLTSVTVSDGVTNIGNSAFNANQITSATIPSSVTSIGNYAFSDNQLTSIAIPDGVTSISEGAFMYNQLTSVTIPDNVTSIGYLAFNNNQLTSVTIPDGVTTIDRWAFASNKLTSITIPTSVTAIGVAAFMDNKISTVTIPNTVTTLGEYAFEANQLTSLTLGCGVNSLASELFAINKLTEVTIPNCITSIDPTAFFGQNSWGGVIDWGEDPAHDWYSSDPDVQNTVRNNLWYARLYTSDPLNPNNLVDGVTDEAWYTGDINGDGDETDSIGGHLINPALVSVRYVDGSNASLSADYLSTGRLADSTNLSDYLIKNIPTPPFVDSQSPTAEEQAALEASFAPYYRIGQDVSFAAPAITGYTLQSPSSPHALHLVGMDNNLSFVYTAPQAVVTPPSPGEVTAPSPSNQGAKSQSTKPATQSTASTPSTIATEDNGNDSNPTPVETRTKVDFAAENGSATNPTARSIPSGLTPIIAKSNLTVDKTKSCNHIDSAKLLSSASFTAPDVNHKTLGGLAFVLNCQAAGGDAKIVFTLGDTISDLSKVKVYKQNSHGVSKDITGQVSFSNQTPDGHTTITYAIKDGQSLDDDGKANSSISDPIYIAVPNNTVKDTVEPSTTKGTSWSNIALIIGGIVVALAITTAIVINKKRRG